MCNLQRIISHAGSTGFTFYFVQFCRTVLRSPTPPAAASYASRAPIGSRSAPCPSRTATGAAPVPAFSDATRARPLFARLVSPVIALGISCSAAGSNRHRAPTATATARFFLARETSSDEPNLRAPAIRLRKMVMMIYFIRILQIPTYIPLPPSHLYISISLSEYTRIYRLQIPCHLDPHPSFCSPYSHRYRYSPP